MRTTRRTCPSTSSPARWRTSSRVTARATSTRSASASPSSRSTSRCRARARASPARSGSSAPRRRRTWSTCNGVPSRPLATVELRPRGTAPIATRRDVFTCGSPDWRFVVDLEPAKYDVTVIPDPDALREYGVNLLPVPFTFPDRAVQASVNLGALNETGARLYGHLTSSGSPIHAPPGLCDAPLASFVFGFVTVENTKDSAGVSIPLTCGSSFAYDVTLPLGPGYRVSFVPGGGRRDRAGAAAGAGEPAVAPHARRGDGARPGPHGHRRRGHDEGAAGARSGPLLRRKPGRGARTTRDQQRRGDAHLAEADDDRADPLPARALPRDAASRPDGLPARVRGEDPRRARPGRAEPQVERPRQPHRWRVERPARGLRLRRRTPEAVGALCPVRARGRPEGVLDRETLRRLPA